MIYNSDTSAQVIGYQYDFIFHNLQLSLRDQPVAVGEIGVIIVAFNLLSQFPMCFLHKYSPRCILALPPPLSVNGRIQMSQMTF